MKIWLLGKVSHGLYQTNKRLLHKNAASQDCPSHSNNKSVLSATAKNNKIAQEAKLWHLRMGHIPFHRLKLLFPQLDDYMSSCKTNKTPLPYSFCKIYITFPTSTCRHIGTF